MQNISLLTNASSIESLQLKWLNSKEENTETHCIEQFLQFGVHVKVLIRVNWEIYCWSVDDPLGHAYFSHCCVAFATCSYVAFALVYLLPPFEPLDGKVNRNDSFEHAIQWRSQGLFHC